MSLTRYNASSQTSVQTLSSATEAATSRTGLRGAVHATRPYISNGPLISWMYPVFGVRGASWFLGVAEWTIGVLLFAGFWDKRLGILGAAGSIVTFIMTVTIIPFMLDGWAASAGGFPAMTGNIPFLMKDVVLLAASIYLLKQDVVRIAQR
jgi:uncharacterized membrane protein YkgB